MKARNFLIAAFIIFLVPALSFAYTIDYFKPIKKKVFAEEKIAKQENPTKINQKDLHLNILPKRKLRATNLNRLIKNTPSLPKLDPSFLAFTFGDNDEIPQINITITPSIVETNEPIEVILTGNDDKGLYAIRALLSDGWHTHYCNNETFCSNTWTTSEPSPGNYSYSAMAVDSSRKASVVSSYVEVVAPPCTESWVLDNNSCQIDDTRLVSYTDANDCGTFDELPGDNGTFEACDYCIPEWYEVNTSCQPDDTITGYYVDANSCYDLTGLSSDNNPPSNNTYACDYCTPNWIEINTSCQPDDTITGYYIDTNDCYASTGLSSDNNPPLNNTYACDYCVPNWVCSGYGACQPDDFQYCEEVSDLNVCGEAYLGNYSEFVPLSCDYCTPNWVEINTSCQPDDTITGYYVDPNGCFNITGLSSDNNPPPNSTYECSYDQSPPSTIANLSAEVGITWILWTWDSPPEPDFEQNIIFFDSVNVANTSNSYYKATGLLPDTTHYITVQTMDNSSNINSTNVSDTQTTLHGELFFGRIYDTDTGSWLEGVNVSFYNASLFDPFNGTGNFSALMPKAIPDAVSNGSGHYSTYLPNGTYHIVMQHSKEIDFNARIDKNKGKGHDAELDEDGNYTDFNVEGHIIHSGNYEHGNNYTCGERVLFTMFGINHGSENITVTFVVEDHTAGGPIGTIVYYGNVSEPSENLLIPANGTKVQKMYEFEIPCSYSSGKHDIHVYDNVKWGRMHKIGNFFVVQDTTLPYVNADDNATIYTNETAVIWYTVVDTAQDGTVRTNEVSTTSSNTADFIVFVDKDISADGDDPDLLPYNDIDQVVAASSLGQFNLSYNVSGYYTARLTAIDLSNNSAYKDVNISVYITEHEADLIADPIYSLFGINDSGFYTHDYDVTIISSSPDVTLNADRYEYIFEQVGDEYITKWDGITDSEAQALQDVIDSCTGPEYMKPTYPSTAEEFNTSIFDFLYRLKCTCGEPYAGPSC